MKPHFTGPIYLLLIELYTDTKKKYIYYIEYIFFSAFKAPRFQIFSLRALAFHGMATEGPWKLVDYPLRLLGTQGRWGQSKWWSYQLPTLSPTKSLNEREKVFWQHSFSSFFFKKIGKKHSFYFFGISEKSMIDGFHQRYGIRSLELGSREIGTIAGPERYMVALTGLSLSKRMNTWNRRFMRLRNHIKIVWGYSVLGA